MFMFQSRLSRLVSQLVLVVATGLLALPLAMIVSVSMQGEGPVNYLRVIDGTPFVRFFANSVLISVSTVAVVTLTATMAAFATVALRPRGHRFAQWLLISGLALPAVALVVPLFYVVQAVGLLNTYWAVVIPLVAISLPFGVLVASNYISALPVEVHEAAKIDGATDWQYFWQVLLPMCRPILAVVVIFTFLSSWNEYLLPLLFIQDTDMQVLTQVPTYFQSQRLVDTPKIFAANVLISLPIIAVYIALQGTFQRGLSAGAIK